ncbi:MAG: hypothetical protein IT369_14465 [Candidatus Latescibacteria bacterium]|nr:hypothetical protein [Candidatus Latescibacterota bacterium]
MVGLGGPGCRDERSDMRPKLKIHKNTNTGRSTGSARTGRSPSPTTEQIFAEFIEEQRPRLKPHTMGQYEAVIDLFSHFLNGYGHENLSPREAARFDKYYAATGAAHREFVQLFGPDRIVENLGGFLGSFLTHKVIAGAEFKRSAGTVTKKLCKWLVAKGHIGEEESAEGISRGADAARDLPKAERAARILFEAEAGNPQDFEDLEEEDYLDFDHFTIARIEPGMLWLRGGGKKGLIGPVGVPAEATRLLQEEWELSCSLGRVRGQWHLVEMANVYPM